MALALFGVFCSTSMTMWSALVFGFIGACARNFCLVIYSFLFSIAVNGFFSTQQFLFSLFHSEFFILDFEYGIDLRMGEAPQFVLYEHAVGYSLLRVKEFEDVGLMIPEVRFAFLDLLL